jgi:endonuclease YncB( thermonuclease family)
MGKHSRDKSKSRGKSGGTMRMPVVRFLAWRNRRRGWYVAVTMVVAILLVLADRRGLLVGPSDDLARYDGQTFVVTRVIDGDTLDIGVPDGDERTTRLRFWGIDSPEMARRDPAREAEPYAQEATDLARQLAKGQRVRLILEPHKFRGHYGRLLVFVELPDGTLLNEKLLSAGLARADSRWSHRHITRFASLEREARDAKRGIWSPKTSKRLELTAEDHR